MTSKTDPFTKGLRTKAHRVEAPDRPIKTERPASPQRKTPRPTVKRTPRLPAYVRHA